MRKRRSELETYRIVLPVRRRIHCGIGRFCFCAFASFCFVRNDLWDCSRKVNMIFGSVWKAQLNVQASCRLVSMNFADELRWFIARYVKCDMCARLF